MQELRYLSQEELEQFIRRIAEPSLKFVKKRLIKVITELADHSQHVPLDDLVTASILTLSSVSSNLVVSLCQAANDYPESDSLNIVKFKAIIQSLISCINSQSKAIENASNIKLN